MLDETRSWVPLPMPDRPTDDQIKAVAAEFRRRLTDLSWAPFNPVRVMRVEFLKLDHMQMAGIMGVSVGWEHSHENGATGIITQALRDIFEKALGRGAAYEAQACFERWRNSWTAEVHRQVANRFPRLPGQGVQGLG